MRPQPPDLSEAAAEWTPQEIFWIVKHGVKMTGMPAFGPSHGDDTLWNVAAFVKQLPAMTPERYGSYSSGGGGHQHSEGSQSAGSQSVGKPSDAAPTAQP